LAFLAIAAFISVEGALIEQFCHLCCVKICLGYLATQQEA
jgi:hypothetical protein